MTLLLDIGNTCMKWAFLGANGLENAGSVLRAEKEFKDLAKASWSDCESPERVLVCNVAGPALKKSATLWIKRHWKVVPEFIQPEVETCGVRNAYHEPRKLGADRWAALIGARHLVKGPRLCHRLRHRHHHRCPGGRWPASGRPDHSRPGPDGASPH
jgi:type III pantothenate kinase